MDYAEIVTRLKQCSNMKVPLVLFPSERAQARKISGMVVGKGSPINKRKKNKYDRIMEDPDKYLKGQHSSIKALFYNLAGMDPKYIVSPFISTFSKDNFHICTQAIARIAGQKKMTRK